MPTNCTNCFSGCEIVSDKCVKYTGPDVSALGISNGDTLLSVETALTTFLSSVLIGTGIKPIIENNVICEIINQYLPSCSECNGYTLNEILNALINASCDLQEQITVINASLTNLNADYTTQCLENVTATSDTHEIVQAVINKLCELEVDLAALALELSTNYVSVANINTYIQNYINSSSASTLVSSKMVPYTVLPFFPTVSAMANFDLSGAGQGSWNKIFLCNGLNGTPDLRGRTLVGSTQGMGGSAMDAEVDPANPANQPAYTPGVKKGVNFVTLTENQLPSHTHAITTNTVVTDPKHSHGLSNIKKHTNIFGLNGLFDQATNGASSGLTTDEKETGISVTVTASAANTGGGLSHNNIQPSMGCHYIIYLP